jgi:hypothetical protein
VWIANMEMAISLLRLQKATFTHRNLSTYFAPK